MMEQLWYTWSTEGLGGVTGYRVRAASDGLMNLNSDRFRSFRAYLNYYLPPGSDPYAATTEDSPVCLAFVDPSNDTTKDPNDQRNTCVLMQKVYKGKDAYGRAGVYFVHLVDLLTERPYDFVASDAIELWQSSFWRKSDTPPPSPNNVRLEQVRPEALKAAITCKYPVNELEEVKDELSFVIQAFLSLKPGQKLYIAGPPERVATLIWGLTHSLPRPFQRAQKLTFSTYEQDVTKAAARVIGTCQPMVTHQNAPVRQQQLLPVDSLSGRGSALALDCYGSDQHSRFKHSPLEQGTVEQKEIAEYASFATECLVSGNKQRLDNLLNSANEGDVTDTGQLRIVFKIHRKALQEGLTAQEITSLMSNPKLAAGLLMEQTVQKTFIGLCVSNPRWWNEQGEPGIKQLRSPFNSSSERRVKEALAALATYAAMELAVALVTNNEAPVSILQQLMLTAAPPEDEPAPWVALLQSVSAQSARVANFHPSKVKWEIRSLLLTQWAYVYKSIDDTFIFPWLQMGWADLDRLLKLQENRLREKPPRPLPERWCQTAIADIIFRYANSNRPPAKGHALFWMNQHYVLFLRSLQTLMRNPTKRPAALWYFTTLTECGFKDKERDLLINLLYASSQSQDQNQDVDGFLRVAQLNPREKADLLRDYGQILLAHQITPSITDIIRQYISKMSVEKLESAEVKQVLQILYQYSVKYHKELAERVQDLYFVSCAVPSKDGDEVETVLSMEPDDLRKVAEAIQHLQLQDNKKLKAGLFDLLINGIRTEASLKAVREIFAPALSSSPQKLFRELAEYLGDLFHPKRIAYDWLMPYVIVALKDAVKLPPQKRDHFLDPLLRALLHNADTKTFEQIDAVASTWSDELRRLWVDYSQNLRPGKRIIGTFLSLPSRSQKSEQDSPPGQYQQRPYDSRDQQNSPVSYRPQQPEFPDQETMPIGAFPWHPEQQPRQISTPSNEQQTILPHPENDSWARQAAPLEQREGLQPQPSANTGSGANGMNAIKLDEGLVQRVHGLKFLYINIRLPQLKKEFGKPRQQGKQDTEGINDEQDELNTHTGNAGNDKSTRCMLENDIIIRRAFNQYPDAENDFNDIFLKVCQQR